MPNAEIRLFLQFAILALLPATHVTGQAQNNFEWKDSSENTHSLSDLEGILRKHQQWINSGYKSGTPADLRGVDLTDAELGGANLTYANLTLAKLIRSNLSDADLTGANLYGADLTSAHLNGAHLNDAHVNHAQLHYAILTGAD